MSSISHEYRLLIESYFAKRITAAELTAMYLTKFKDENRHIPDEEFEVLDEIFADLDAFTTDHGLIRENPDFYLDEDRLKERVAEALTRLP